MAYLSYTKDMQGVADVFLRDPGLYAPLLQYIEAVMTRPSELSKAEREIIAAHVSRINGCDFCVGAHRWTLAALDVGWDVIDALVAAPEVNSLSPKMRQVLRFAQKLTKTPHDVRQPDIDALLATGLSEQGVEDAINVVALFNTVNRLVDALRIENDDTYFRQIGQTLATRSYAPLITTALKRAS